MALEILDATVESNLAAANDQNQWLTALSAPWAGGDVTVRIYGTGDVLRDTLTLAPFSINSETNPQRLVCGALSARTNTSIGDITKVVFRTGSADIFSYVAGTAGTENDITFYGNIKALCNPNLTSIYVAAPAELVIVPAWAPGSGEIANISLNDRDDINPRSDATLNPNAPSLAPWETSVGWGGTALSAYCGAVFATDLGTYGKYLMYGAPGHATNLEYCGFAAYDVATRQWELLNDAPPTPLVTTYVANTTPPTSQLDHTWGEWIGDSADWDVDFRRSGYNPPMGGHTRNSFVYIPASDAGNTSGKIIIAWHPTGNQSGTGIAGSFVYDCDTGLFSRTSNVRPSHGSAVSGMAYHADQNVVIGYNRASGATTSELDFLDLSTLTWTRRNATAGVAAFVDSTNFICGDLYISVTNDTTMSFRAAPVSTVKAGGSWSWTSLTVSATSWPTNGSGVTYTTQWARCPINGAWYAVNRQAGSTTLWKLTKPTGIADSDTAGLLAGTWNVTSESLTGAGLEAATYDYSRLQWCPDIVAFLWVGDTHTGNVQAIRPVGI